jgi:hypothetical protein
VADVIQMATKSTWKVTLNVDSKPWPGFWDVKTGGEVDSDAGDSYKPGGMEPAIALGGSVKTGNVTLSRACRLERDWKSIQTLVNGAGKSVVSIAQAVLDKDGNDYSSNPIVYTGKLKRVTPPEVDSNSTDISMIEIEIVCDGVPHFGA